MQCIWRTKRRTRCKNQSKIGLCRHHIWKPFLLMFSIFTATAVVGGFYQDIWNPLNSFSTIDFSVEAIHKYNTVPVFIENDFYSRKKNPIKWGTRIRIYNNNEKVIIINDIKFKLNYNNEITSKPKPFYKILNDKLLNDNLFNQKYPILIPPKNNIYLDIVFHIIGFKQEEKKTIMQNEYISEIFGCTASNPTCDEIEYDIDFFAQKDKQEKVIKSHQKTRIHFVGKKSSSGGIVTRFKVTPLTIIGKSDGKNVSYVVYSGGKKVENYINLSTEELHDLNFTNKGDFDLCSILFGRVVLVNNYNYSKSILDSCTPTNIFEKSMLKSNYGVLEFENRNYEKGLAHLHESKLITKCNGLADKNIFEYYVYKNNYHKAAQVAIERIKTCNEYVDHWAYILFLLRNNINSDLKLIDTFKKLSISRPSDGNIKFYLGQLYASNKQYDISINHYINSITLDTNFIKDSLLEASNISRIVKNYSDSEKYARKLVQLDEKSFLGHYHLAFANFMQKKYKKAENHYMIALSINNNDFAVLYEISELYNTIGDKEKSIKYRELSYQYWPDGYSKPIKKIEPE